MAEAPTRTWPALDLDLRPGTPVPADADDRLALALDDAGPVAVESDGASHWRVFFEAPDARDTAADLLRDALGGWLAIEPTEVADEGWAIKVQRDLGAVAAGRFLVAPPWDVPAAADGSMLVVIEPSAGFGTGHHQSTRLCLRALDRLPVHGARVIDAGTGSGVLAIAAARLGAAGVIAIDHDADAVASARANVSRNLVDAVVGCEVADLSAFAATPADIVVANLTVHLLRRFARTLAALVRPGGTIVASGFTHDQVPLVLDAFPGFRAVATESEDDWVGLTLAGDRA